MEVHTRFVHDITSIRFVLNVTLVCMQGDFDYVNVLHVWTHYKPYRKKRFLLRIYYVLDEGGGVRLIFYARLQGAIRGKGGSCEMVPWYWLY